jgi:hypothetical protein
VDCITLSQRVIKVILGPAPAVSAQQVTEMHADSVEKLSTNKNEFNIVMEGRGFKYR